jgi:hypothetical protein
MDNDSNDRTDLEPLPCAECAQLVILNDDTRIGISRIDGGPAPLCSPACEAENVRRILEAPRCRCGAAADLQTSLMLVLGEIVGCPACAWSGSQPAGAGDLHYLGVVGGALCGASFFAGAAVTMTTDRSAVGCASCAQLLDQVGPALTVGGVS